jgi:hypothetical protein
VLLARISSFRLQTYLSRVHRILVAQSILEQCERSYSNSSDASTRLGFTLAPSDLDNIDPAPLVHPVLHHVIPSVRAALLQLALVHGVYGEASERAGRFATNEE